MLNYNKGRRGAVGCTSDS